MLLTALGGAIGASARTFLQLYLTNIHKNGLLLRISVHAWGAFLVGLLTHPGFPKEIVAVYEAALRTISAIVTVDVYNCLIAGNGDMAALYLSVCISCNLIMNHCGRKLGSHLRNLLSTDTIGLIR
ncbi:hypothetical protein GUITHDRAFT_150218 [Guillardia theta CCMP2712]|uniref:Uncharacterized protein n=1 Tax=Guillardia theta (strain CCMP2712) TaxID=905079 RepID=L1JYW1_GUITC|nr:hypothetical protein GUITHDRAFT_150218 [Guillardia theta CCMP2712]EKX53562.1 hypothetical protein GUITHDRAFT_150218 [Guillardia theta CCMP2712]|eukprot:XP_005840542.1 hypothetical protein GUITHDRAFT_150218 [Guillardia theta CCMP2712]